MQFIGSALLLFLALSASAGAACAAESAASSCSSVSGLHLVCGQERPEDIARIPDTRWLIVSGFSEGAGLKLVDTRNGELTPAYSASPAQIPVDAEFRDCASPPNPTLFNTQGISLRRTSRAGEYTLYVVNHGGRESVEVFTVHARESTPLLTWRGCALLPQGLAANSVAAYSDGTLLITVLVHPGDTYADFVQGRDTGGVYERRPGSAGFKLVPGTRLPGNNGIETARDDSGFFVVAFGRRAVLRYSRHDTSATPVEAIAPGFMPDNIHWNGDRLMAAGMIYDEPACGGTRKIIDGKADAMRCHRGTVVAEFDPQAITFRTVAYTVPHPRFNGASAAVVVDDFLWIGSYQSDCLAKLRLASGASNN